VLDDELAQRVTLEALLSEEFDVVLTATVAEARQELEKRRFDVALIDYQLPKVPGSYLVDLARERFPWVVLILITAHDRDAGVVELRDRRAIPVLRKPCTPELVLGAVRSAVALGRMRASRR
jgi:DNA-binding NtrC family response regulator